MEMFYSIHLVMKTLLDSKHVAILATDGFEQSELEVPLQALERVGAKVSIISPQPDEIHGVHHDEKGDAFATDIKLDLADPEDFDALVLPGGLANPDSLRGMPEAVAFVRGFGISGKPIAAICHGPWLLIEAGLVDGRRLTSWPAIQTDVRNAGGLWVDEEVVVDHQLVTSRQPEDLPAFNAKMIEIFAKGQQEPIGEGAIPPQDG